MARLRLRSPGSLRARSRRRGKADSCARSGGRVFLQSGGAKSGPSLLAMGSHFRREAIMRVTSSALTRRLSRVAFQSKPLKSSSTTLSGHGKGWACSNAARPAGLGCASFWARGSWCVRSCRFTSLNVDRLMRELHSKARSDEGLGYQTGFHLLAATALLNMPSPAGARLHSFCVPHHSH